jgi:hypothetical protein
MIDSLDETLLGYLVGALDEDQHAEVERQLATDADARRRLAVLRKGLVPLEEARGEFEPPAGLAARTCRFVFEQADAQEEPAVVGGGRPVVRMHEVALSGGTEGSFRWQDMAMAVGIVIAASLLLFPAIHGSRVQARLMACQDNLRELGSALTNYSERHQGYFPKVPEKGNLAAASAYGPILASGQYLPSDKTVVCPDSPLATTGDFCIPTLEEVKTAASPDEIQQMQQVMGGSYGYTLGYQDGDQYSATRNLRRPHFAIASDAPEQGSDGQWSNTHGRMGQNFLFEDGHVRFLTAPQSTDVRGDHFFLNDDGKVAAGVHENDAVIGAGATPPIRFVSQ